MWCASEGLKCLDRERLLTVVLAALVGGTPRVVALDLVRVLLQAVVLRAVVGVAVDRFCCQIPFG